MSITYNKKKTFKKDFLKKGGDGDELNDEMVYKINNGKITVDIYKILTSPFIITTSNIIYLIMYLLCLIIVILNYINILIYIIIIIYDYIIILNNDDIIIKDTLKYKLISYVDYVFINTNNIFTTDKKK